MGEWQATQVRSPEKKIKNKSPAYQVIMVPVQAPNTSSTFIILPPRRFPTPVGPHVNLQADCAPLRAYSYEIYINTAQCRALSLR